MRREDIPFAVRLSDQEHWGVTSQDLSRILMLDPKGSFIALSLRKKIGLVTTTRYGGTLGWIGNVVVDRAYRGKHVGQTLVLTAVDYLRRRKIKHIALYCFDNNVKFYEKLGFKQDASFLRLRRRPKPVGITSPAPHPQRKLTLREVLSADKKGFGADRSRLIRNLLRTNAGWYLGAASRYSASSFLLVKEYEDGYEFGPWVCIRPLSNQPRELLQLALTKTARKTIEVSCLRSHRISLRLLRQNGFAVTNHGHRMYLGQTAKIGNDEANYALGFLDKG